MDKSWLWQFNSSAGRNGILRWIGRQVAVSPRMFLGDGSDGDPIAPSAVGIWSRSEAINGIKPLLGFPGGGAFLGTSFGGLRCSLHASSLTLPPIHSTKPYCCVKWGYWPAMLSGYPASWWSDPAVCLRGTGDRQSLTVTAGGSPGGPPSGPIGVWESFILRRGGASSKFSPRSPASMRRRFHSRHRFSISWRPSSRSLSRWGTTYFSWNQLAITIINLVNSDAATAMPAAPAASEPPSAITSRIILWMLSFCFWRCVSLRSGFWFRVCSYCRRACSLASAVIGFLALVVFLAVLGLGSTVMGAGRSKVNSKVWPIAHSGQNWGSPTTQH